jgi:DNA-binding Xre family transcriptional regulator
VTDMYARPSRDEIRGKLGIPDDVRSALPGADPDDDAPADTDFPAAAFAEFRARPAPVTNAAFSAHVAASLRKHNWTQRELAARAGVDTAGISKLLDGTAMRPTLATAAAIADALELSLDAMTRPYECGTCHGSPPPGFSCLECSSCGERP